MTDKRRFRPKPHDAFDRDDEAARDRAVRPMSNEEARQGEVIPDPEEVDERD